MQTTIGREFEITEEHGEGSNDRIDPEIQKESIRKIIAYQKSLHHLSSSSPSDSLSFLSRSFSSSSCSSSLLELMKVGGMSLRRLFDMEHTTLAAHLTNYSASPITRPLFLWGSDSCDESLDLRYWSPVMSFRKSREDYGPSSLDGRVAEGRYADRLSAYTKRSLKRRKLTRKRSYRALPRLRLWRFKGFRLLFRLRRRLTVLICGKVYA